MNVFYSEHEISLYIALSLECDRLSLTIYTSVSVQMFCPLGFFRYCYTAKT